MLNRYMTLSHGRRDKNDHELAKAARAMGCILHLSPPLDYLAWWAGCSTHWTLVEIKQAHRKGHASEFTKAQRDFMRLCDEIGAKYEIWRTIGDVEQSRCDAQKELG